MSVPPQWTFLGVVCAIVLGSPASRGQDVSVQEFRALVLANLPDSGAVEATFVPGKGVAKYIVGFDLATGAWYQIGNGRVVGTDPSGMAFRGTELPGSIRPVPDASEDVLCDEVVEQWLPFVILRDLVNRSEVVDHISRRKGGGFDLMAVFHGGTRRSKNPPSDDPNARVDHTLHLELDTQARIIGYQWDDYSGLHFEYDGSEPGLVPASITGSIGWQAVERRLWHGDATKHFTMPEVERRAALAPTAPSTLLSQLGRAGTEGTKRGWGTRGPLLLAGVMVFCVGILAWWRRRSP